MKKTVKNIIGIACASSVAIMAFSGCDKKDEAVFSIDQAKSTDALKVEDIIVKQDMFYLYLIQYIYNSCLQSKDVTDDSLSSAINYTVSELQLEMVEYQLSLVTEGVTVTDEDLEQADKNAEFFCNTFPEDFLNKYGISMDTVKQLFEQQTYINALINKTKLDMTQDLYDKYEETYEELVFHNMYYVLFPSIQYDEEGNAVEDGDGNPVSLSDSEMEKQKSNAEEVMRRALEGENLEDLAEEYGVTHCSGNEINYSGAYDASLNKIIDEMENGDISEVVETAAGYMVIRMDNNNDTNYKEYWMAYMAKEEAGNLVPTMQQNWMNSVSISDSDVNQDVIDTIDLKKLCEDMEKAGINISGD